MEDLGIDDNINKNIEKQGGRESDSCASRYRKVEIGEELQKEFHKRRGIY